MKSLLWKQWREARVYLGIFTAWMVLVACYVVAYEVGHRYRAPVGHFSGWAMLYSLFAGIVLATLVSHRERADGTISFSAALPISLRRMGAVRITGAVATLGIPILVAAAGLSIALASGIVEQAEPRLADSHIRLEQRGNAGLSTSLEQLWSVTAIAVLGGAEFLLLLSLLGCYLRGQAQVGLAGAALSLVALIAGGALWYGQLNPWAQLAYGAILPQSLVIQWSYGDDFGSYTDHELARYRWAAMGLSLPILASLGYFFAARYGAMSRLWSAPRRRHFRVSLPPILSRIPVRPPGRLPAMIWLEARQSLPLAGFGLLLAILMSVSTVLIEVRHNDSFGSSVLIDLPHSAFAVAMLWSIVVGSGLFSRDLGAGLGAFWRSRPISPALWFWTKFLVGLAAVLAVLDGIPILACWNAPRPTLTGGMSWAYVGCLPILHALLYSLAVLGTCWFRRPVIGGILAILGYALLTVGITSFSATNRLEPIHVHNALLMAERGGKLDFRQHGYPLVYGVLLASIVLLAILSNRLARPLQPSSRWLGPRAG
jgi:hypothetical protein